MSEKPLPPWQNLIEELDKQPEVVKKYNHPGIYSISIAGRVVYIGKSRNMLIRLAQHIYYTTYPNYNTAHKYKIINLAKFMGYEVSFNVISHCPYIPSTTGIDEWLGQEEGELIREYLPPLNYQIPKEDNYHSFTVNRHAKDITLMEILGDSK